MKKYYVYAGTETYKKEKNKWVYDCSICDPLYSESFDNYDDAKNFYDKITLKDESSVKRYSDYKQLYSYDEKDINDKLCYSMDNMQLLKEEYVLNVNQL